MDARLVFVVPSPVTASALTRTVTSWPKVKKPTYQPTAAELKEDLDIDATPEEVAETVMESVAVYESDDEKSRPSD